MYTLGNQKMTGHFRCGELGADQGMVMKQDQAWRLQTVHIHLLHALFADLQRPALLLLDRAVPGLFLCHDAAL